MSLEASVTPPPKLRDVARSLIAPEAAARTSLVLTLALIVFYGPTVWYVKVPVAMLALIGWTWPGALRAPLLWTALAAVLGAGVFLKRFTVDNHQYLMAYWCAALAISLGDPSGEALRRNARILVGLAFGFAAAWKWATPEFVSGAFLEYEMLCDPRFAGFTEVLTGLPAQALEANRAAMEGLTSQGAGETVAALTTVPAVSTIADVMTWSTLILESWIAIAFLVPRSGPLGRYRDLPLLAFLLTTYAVATVPGFAYLLLAMGFVQCERRRWWIPAGYLVAALALQIFLLPLRHVAGAIGL